MSLSEEDALKARIAELENQLAEGVPEEAPVDLPFSEYTVGERVEAFNPDDGEWYPGRITEITPNNTYIHVSTERGPKTVGTKRRLRKAK